MTTKKFEITEGDRKIDKAKEHEKEKEYEKASNEYEEAEIIYRENNEFIRSAKCFAAKNINLIKFHLRGRDIDTLSSNMIDFLIEQIEQINNMERLRLLERLEILITSYQELEDFFRNNFMVEKENEIYFKRTSLIHKFHWEKFKDNSIEKKKRKNFAYYLILVINFLWMYFKKIIEKLKKNSFYIRIMEKLINSSFYKKIKELLKYLISFFLHIFCGHGEKRWRAFGWMAFTIIIFAWIYYCFNLIQFTTQRSDPINFFHALYFSVITFTSLGYGDIIPICNGKILASIEVLLGLLMFGILIASMTRKMQK